MRQIIIFIAFIFSIKFSKGQDDSAIFVKEFKWIFILPQHLKLADSASFKMEVQHQKKIYAINPADSASVASYFNNVKFLILAKTSEGSKFSVFYVDTKFDPNKGQFNPSSYVGNPDIKAYQTKINYAGVIFDRLQLEMMSRLNTSIKSVILKCVYEGKVFNIMYSYHDPRIGNEIEGMLKNSKFKR